MTFALRGEFALTRLPQAARQVLYALLEVTPYLLIFLTRCTQSATLTTIPSC